MGIRYSQRRSKELGKICTLAFKKAIDAGKPFYMTQEYMVYEAGVYFSENRAMKEGLLKLADEKSLNSSSS